MLTTLTVRRSLDGLKRASKQRAQYQGPWLPTPLVEDWRDTERAQEAQIQREPQDPALQWEMSENLSTAFMLMLERLSPLERAVFILRQGFDLSFQDIGESVEQSADYCRQLHRRAQQHLAGKQERFEVDDAQHQKVFEQFLEALANADVGAIKQVLAEDAISYSDGGGKALAALRPISGQDKVTRLIMGMLKKQAFNIDMHLCTINTLPGMILYNGHQAINALSTEIFEGKIRTIYMTRNPDKLQHLHL
jgi:RNA polymerase sigma-70 factor (ECF subfamily)